MAHWLFKSEPRKWSWQKMVAAGESGTEWDGVRNYQARNFMRAMLVGETGFFYHSNEGLEIVGIVEVARSAHHDRTTDDPRWDCVGLRALHALPRPVSLAEIKATPALSAMSLVTSFRLSVQPVRDDEWRLICEMGGL